MASDRPVRLSVLFAIGLSAVVFPCPLAISPAFGQTDVVGIINGIIQRQQELAERRRQETAAYRQMQYGLSQLGFYDGPIDGDFGPQTAEALAAYRRSIGRPNSEPPSYKEIAEIESRADEQIKSSPPPGPPSAPTEPTHKSEIPRSPPPGPASTPTEPIHKSGFLRADAPPEIDASLPDVAGWIIIASRSTPEEAKLVAEQYVQSFPSTTVIRTASGSFAITIGWLNKEYGSPLKDSLISRNSIPHDSFLSSGEKFEPPIWSVDGQRIQSRIDLLRYSLLRTTPANGMIAGFQDEVTGLSDSSADYLSLRSDPSTSSKELRQLPDGTLLKVRQSKDGWQQVELLNGMTGWVSLGQVVVPKEPVPPPETVRCDRIKRDANTLADNLSVYVRVHPETPDIASIAQEFSKLKAAIDNDDCPAIEAAGGTLKHQMEAAPGWSDFVRSRAEEARQAEIQALGEAVSLASKNQGFLHDQIGKNLTSPNTPTLATLLKKYESALRSPVLSTLTDLNDQLKKTVSDMGLEDAYNEWMTEAPETQQKPPESEIDETTKKNRFLLEGALTDWVLLFNAGTKAPHVARNIRGDIVFEGQQADACVLHSAAGKIEVAQVEDILRGYKVDTVRLDPSPCPETNLQSHDVLIAMRGELLKQPPSYLAPLLGLVQDGTFQELKTLTSEEFEKSAKAREVEATEIENAILAGTREGYGLIKIDNDSAVICMTIAEQEEAHRALINDQRKVLLRSFKAAPEVQPTTVEAGFIAVKRGQCGAIYARRSDLSDAIQSFRRDKVPVSVVPLWFEPKQVADRADEIQRENERLARQQQNWKRQKEEAEALKTQRDQADKEKKERREAELRTQHGSQARALAEEIENAIKLLVDDKETWANSEFQQLASWYRDRTADGWEFTALDDKIADYGTADWKGRPLEVVFTDVSISMKNRLLGENKTFCFSLGLIFDAEFKKHREPFEKECKDAAEPSRAWKQGQGFRSQWVAE